MTSADKYPFLFSSRVYRSEVYTPDDKTVELEVVIAPVRPDYSSKVVEMRAEELEVYDKAS